MTKEPVLLGRPPLLRRTNAQLLLKLLRANGPCSKADLVRASGLSAPTVTNVIAHLASAGLIEPVGEGDSTGGRPPDILRFRAERGCVLGVEICGTSLHFLLADLEGREVDRASLQLTRPASRPPAVCAKIGSEARRLVHENNFADSQLLAAVVGVPAIVNLNDREVIAYSPLIGWHDVPLGALLSRELKCDAIVENDTNLAALGEYSRGAARNEKNFVFITIGDGVGAGIFVDGNIYRGSQWSAGEIGYLRVPSISREHPRIHGFGKLEKVLGAPGILRSWRAVSRRTRADRQIESASEVFDIASAGNAKAKRILAQRAKILADVILDVALILNPSLILLGGEVGSHPRLQQETKKLLKGSEFAKVRLGSGELGESAVLWGAIYRAREAAILSLIQQSSPAA